MNKVNLPSVRIPVLPTEPLPEMKHDYVLMVPTFGAGKTMGAIPMRVRKLLNEDPATREHCVGVIGSGNTTFGSYATSVDLISKKLEVPALYKYEVLGMPEDVVNVREILFKLFPELEEYRSAQAGTFSHLSAFQ